MNNKLKSISIVISSLWLISIFMGCEEKPIIQWTPIKPCSSVNAKPSVKVYLDNSGSMDGYMCVGSELKDAVYSYVSSLTPFVQTTQLYYINSQIRPCNKSLQSFISKSSTGSTSSGRRKCKLF